jgi:FlaA1/EpsC-like NDP-sugar epimerase
MLRAFDTPVLKAALFTVFVDLSLVALSIYVSIGLKYDDWALAFQMPLMQFLLTVLPLITLVVFYGMRLYRGSWRHVGLEDLMRSSWAVVVSTAIAWVVAAVVMFRPAPVSFFVIYALVAITLVNSARAAYHMMFYLTARAATDRDRVLIYGAGMGGAMAVRELLANGDLGMLPVGFVDDDPRRVGQHMSGYPVFGGIAELPAIVAREKPSGLLISTNKISSSRVAEARRLAGAAGIWIRTIRIEVRPVFDRVTEPIALVTNDEDVAVAERER